MSLISKKFKTLGLLTIFMFAFGIGDLNFDNLAIDENGKAYLLIGMSLVAMIALLVLSYRDNKIE